MFQKPIPLNNPYIIAATVIFVLTLPLVAVEQVALKLDNSNLYGSVFTHVLARLPYDQTLQMLVSVGCALTVISVAISRLMFRLNILLTLLIAVIVLLAAANLVWFHIVQVGITG